MKLVSLVCLFFATASFAQVAVTSPTNNSTVGSTVQVVATISTSSCSKGISASGVYVDNVLQNVTNGNKLNTPISLTPGKHYVVVLGWDYCGGAVTAPLNLTVPTNAGVTVTS